MKIARSRLREYVEAKENELGFKITHSQISNATGIRRPTITQWMSDAPIERIDMRILLALADYFGCDSPFDMLSIEDVEYDSD